MDIVGRRWPRLLSTAKPVHAPRWNIFGLIPSRSRTISLQFGRLGVALARESTLSTLMDARWHPRTILTLDALRLVSIGTRVFHEIRHFASRWTQKLDQRIRENSIEVVSSERKKFTFNVWVTRLFCHFVINHFDYGRLWDVSAGRDNENVRRAFLRKYIEIIWKDRCVPWSYLVIYIFTFLFLFMAWM